MNTVQYARYGSDSSILLWKTICDGILKTTHMGVGERIRILMPSGLLIRAEHTFKSISRFFL